MNEDKIIQAVLENREGIEKIKETMVTKKDHEQVIGLLDEIKEIVQKQDQEMTMLGQRVERVEEKAEKNIKDIQTIKPLVGFAEA
ncbi:MAG: hypothetical protein ABII02_02540 [Candidatus Magasanikbacteria bacterium]